MVDPVLLEAIRRTPGDEAPRLGLADWFDAQGDARGAVIRLQLEIARLEDIEVQGKLGEEQELRLRELRSQEKDLQPTSDFLWYNALGVEWKEVTSVRGEVDLTLSWKRCLEVGERVTQRAAVRTLRLESGLGSTGKAMALLGESALLDRVRALDLCGGTITAKGMVALASSAHLVNVTSLNLRYNKYGGPRKLDSRLPNADRLPSRAGRG